MERRTLLGLLAAMPVVAKAAEVCDPHALGACPNILLDTNTTWDGAPMAYLKTKHPRLNIRTIQFSPGIFNGWHIHETPVYIYVMEGDFQVDMIDKQGNQITKVFHAGEAFSEVVDTVHRGGNPSTDTWTKLVVVNTTQDDCPFMTPVGSPPVCKAKWSGPHGEEGEHRGHGEH